MLKTIVGDITKANTDVIVNASNGIGFMGGIIGKHIKCEGVAESIHYETKGIVEKECKQKIKIHKFIPAIITGVGHLKAKKVFDIYKESFSEINDIDIYVYVLKELK